MLFSGDVEGNLSDIEKGRLKGVECKNEGFLLHTIPDSLIPKNDDKKLLFYCSPYECTMMLFACVKRQQMLIDHGSKKIRRGMGYVSAASMQSKFEKCIACELGKKNSDKLGIVLKASYPVTVVPEDLQSDLDVPE